MKDIFDDFSGGLESPATHVEAATPDDTTDLANASRAINAAAAGAVRVTTVGGSTGTVYVAAEVPFRSGQRASGDRNHRDWHRGSVLMAAYSIGLGLGCCISAHLGDIDVPVLPDPLPELIPRPRLRAHNQRSTVAARAMAERNTTGDLS